MKNFASLWFFFAFLSVVEHYAGGHAYWWQLPCAQASAGMFLLMSKDE